MGAHAALGAKGRNHWGEGRHLLTKVDRRPSPLRLLPLAIPSSHPPTGGRTSRALPALLLHQTAKFSRGVCCDASLRAQRMV